MKPENGTPDEGWEPVVIIENRAGASYRLSHGDGRVVEVGDAEDAYMVVADVIDHLFPVEGHDRIPLPRQAGTESEAKDNLHENPED